MNVYMELTNPIHGGEGWELGEVLWSPVGGPWNNIMTKPEKGDLIIHSVKQRSPIVNHKLWGYSFVADSAIITEEKPPIPDRWENYDEYYVIPLSDYTPFEEKKFTQNFLNDYADEISNIENITYQFYSRAYPPEIVQKYLTIVPKKVKDLVEEFTSVNMKPQLTREPSRISTKEIISSTNGNGKPIRVNTVVERIVRNTKIIKDLKSNTDDRCQICGKKIYLREGKYYSEGHHLQKLGGIHQGPDVVGNVIILCPNHHVEFDFGSIAIDPESMKILQIDPYNSAVNQPVAYSRNNLEKKYIKYHYDHIYKGKK